jgi:hypothetical protein
MPTFKFTSPDGKQYTVNGPDGATEQQAFQMLQSQIAPAPQKAKPFGEQLNEFIKEAPRQVGLTARYGLEGAGDALDFLASPIRAGLNAVLPNKQRGIADIIADTKPRPAIEGRSGKVLADLLHLPEPQTSGERVVGDAARTLAGGAVPLGLASRVAGGTSGVTQAVARNLAANPLQQLASAGAAGAAGGYTRETGGGAGAQTLASLAAGVAAPYAAGKIAQGAGALRELANRPGPTPSQIDITINNALQPSGLNLSQLAPDVQAGIRSDVAQALRVSDNLSPEALSRLVDYRMTGATPTVGKLTRDPATFTQEENLMRIGANSKDVAAQTLGRVKNANNARLIEVLNNAGTSTKDDAIAGAEKVISALSQQEARAKGIIGGLYEKARDSQGRSAALDPYAFTQRAGDLLHEANVESFLTPDIRNKLNSFASGQTPLTVEIAEQLKTGIGRIQRSSSDGNVRHALGLVRQALDETPLLNQGGTATPIGGNQLTVPGGLQAASQDIGQEAIDAFNRARSFNRRWEKVVGRTPALQAVRDGVEPDKFVQQFIVGSGDKASVASLSALRQSIKNTPEAVDAVRGQIVASLKKNALNGASDEVGSFSQSAYNKQLDAIGERKLRMFFTEPEINQLKAVGRVASYEQKEPVGGAVNRSNSAAGIYGILDRIAGSPLLSKIPFGRVLAQPAENIVIGLRAKDALNAPRALVDQEQAAPVPALTRLAGLGVSPAVIQGQQEEQR